MSSRQSNTCFCAIRKEFVKETPEERVRQDTLSSLLLLGYPASLTVVERKISDLPHIATSKIKMPNRRIDIICYQGATLCPLVLVECKAKAFSLKSSSEDADFTFKNKELRQLLGYNFYIQSKFVALVCPQTVQFFDIHGRYLHDFFPPYKDIT